MVQAYYRVEYLWDFDLDICMHNFLSFSFFLLLVSGWEEGRKGKKKIKKKKKKIRQSQVRDFYH